MKVVKVTRDLPYGLLDLDTGNFIGFFATEAGALEAVVDALDRYGSQGVETLALARFVDGDVQAIAEGAALAQRAVAAVGVKESPSTATPARGRCAPSTSAAEHVR